jgi:ribosome-associated protein
MIAQEIVNAVEDKKAENILLLDLRPDVVIADFFILCTASGERQIRAVADNVREVMKAKFGRLPFTVEGEGASGWVLMDYGDVIAHIMTEDMRRYYDLEGLWNEATPLVRIQ